MIGEKLKDVSVPDGLLAVNTVGRDVPDGPDALVTVPTETAR